MNLSYALCTYSFKVYYDFNTSLGQAWTIAKGLLHILIFNKKCSERLGSLNESCHSDGRVKNDW
ncbi:hypothetical protein SAMN05421677_11995 [Halobacillus aidingensis]|uniref:Uncharacterized protein n=1 Tax=Halobacillus aidingensis TaxID=240303 RepID=A0A1H0SZS4_HALAD|nr:hypothetical protein SAMN05421677_11995 [Halobacillus aidingensis]